jgi:hypothetical protein
MPKAVQSSFWEMEIERVFVNGGWVMVFEEDGGDGRDERDEEKRSAADCAAADIVWMIVRISRFVWLRLPGCERFVALTILRARQYCSCKSTSGTVSICQT